MPIPEQIRWKLQRAQQHYEELIRELNHYFQNDPGELIEAPDSSPEKQLFVFEAKKRIPPQFALVAGDFLQNLRTSLDYLVWQLVIANGKEPGRSNAFPICSEGKPDLWDKALDRGRMKGLDAEAVRVVRLLQPCFASSAHPNPLTVLETLSNENKHRQILLTGLATIVTPEVKPPIGHTEYQVSRFRNGQMVDEESFMAFIAFKGGIANGLEILSTLEVFSNAIQIEILPQFEQFF